MRHRCIYAEKGKVDPESDSIKQAAPEKGGIRKIVTVPAELSAGLFYHMLLTYDRMDETIRQT